MWKLTLRPASCTSDVRSLYEQSQSVKSNVQKPKSAIVGLRMDPTLKEAAIQAASADQRTLTSLIEKLLTDYCLEHGYLKPAPIKAGVFPGRAFVGFSHVRGTSNPQPSTTETTTDESGEKPKPTRSKTAKSNP